MSEAIEQAAEAALAEAAHQFLSDAVAHLEATMPARIDAAEQEVQDWARNAVNVVHGAIAFIDGHRATPAGPTRPVAASTPPTPVSTASATTAASSSTEAAK